MDLLNTLSPQLKLGIGFFAFVGLVIFSLTKSLISAAQRDALVETLKNKQLGVAEQAASAIMSSEKQAKRGSGRGDRLAFEAVNLKAISRDMRRAGLPPIPVLVPIAAVLLSYLVARFILNVPILSLNVQAAMVFPFMYPVSRYTLINALINSRKMKALTQLIQFVESVQRAVSVGASPDEAVTEAIMETSKPLRDSLIVVKELLDLGYDFIEAVNLAADQIDLPEFDIFAASLSAQASSGGTIGSVLRDVVEIARSRLDLKRKIATMTAEGQFNAVLLGSLPIGLTLYLRNAQPEYFNQMWREPVLGSAIFFGTIGMSCLGAYLAMRISKISM